MTTTGSRRPIAIWLLICCLAIYGMVVLGGVTRLTGSGLSMVKWEPVIGVLPPMNQAAWEEVFELYKQFPEFKIKNSQMDLEGFKGIFWFEYAHRVLGRLIGFIFLVPFLYFLARRQIDRKLIPKLVSMFILGGLQGLLGWYMVKSGLSQDPHVSQYRLTAHLGMAFLIYGYMFWIALDLLFPKSTAKTDAGTGGLRIFSNVLVGLISVTILSGGFVAGLKAGLAYNTFPTMNGQWIPEGMATLTPLWKNFFENVTTVQFDHRLLATLLFLLVPLFWMTSRQYVLSGRLRLGINLLMVVLLIQIALGISTLLLHVPVSLAATHQGGALALFTVAIFVSHQLGENQG